MTFRTLQNVHYNLLATYQVQVPGRTVWASAGLISGPLKQHPTEKSKTRIERNRHALLLPLSYHVELRPDL
jgi:hypothetical protein